MSINSNGHGERDTVSLETVLPAKESLILERFQMLWER